MSELEKLEMDYQTDHAKLFTTLLGSFYNRVDKLQKECKHEKTHWMQELRKDGSFKEGLFKRCFVCGVTVETLALKDSVIEVLMKKFDVSVEQKKPKGCVQRVDPK
jgi:hypothetical protein